MSESPYAFPHSYIGDDGQEYQRPGMTLLDYFAIRVMVGLLNPDVKYHYTESLEKTAYNIAQNMLDQKARLENE